MKRRARKVSLGVVTVPPAPEVVARGAEQVATTLDMTICRSEQIGARTSKVIRCVPNVVSRPDPVPRVFVQVLPRFPRDGPAPEPGT